MTFPSGLETKVSKKKKEWKFGVAIEKLWWDKKTVSRNAEKKHTCHTVVDGTPYPGCPG